MKHLAAITIFLGSFLVFGVQPLVGRTLLPVFGGMASVWVTCLAAFQVLLLIGYFYAHLLGGGEKEHRSAWILRGHLLLLLLAVGWFVLVAFKYKVLANLTSAIPVPALGALAAVCILAGFPYLLLSANSSLVQVLAAGNYRLYAVSNAGSFLGLLAYPILFELFLPIRQQWLALAGLCFLYAVLLGALMIGAGKDNGEASRQETTSVAGDEAQPLPEQSSKPWLWLVLPGASCFLLNAATTHLTSNVAPIPLIWVLLLGIFLLSYVVGFAKIGEKLLPVWLPAAYLTALIAAWAMSAGGNTAEQFRWNIFAVPILLFFGCTALHSWLCHVRPPARFLTRYYLFMSIGGAVGGVLSSIVAPLVLSRTREYPISLVITAALVLVAPTMIWKTRLAVYVSKAKFVVLGLLGLVFVTAMFSEARIRRNVLAEGRSFYGAWRVSNEPIFNQYGKRYDLYTFSHGGTAHGLQAVDEFYRNEPTAYYGRETAGLAFDLARGSDTNRAMRASIIGLGVGTMALYGRPGDEVRFYEICPQVADVAMNGKWFDFLKRCQGKVDVVVNDARKALEAEFEANEPKYDLLAVDAYSGDSIPMHLITVEAFELYKSRLKDDGVLALHISNWNIDLLPIVKAAAKQLGMEVSVVSTRPGLFTIDAQWAYLSKRKLKFPDGTYRLNMPEVRDVDLPTDEKGSLLPFINLSLD